MRMTDPQGKTAPDQSSTLASEIPPIEAINHQRRRSMDQDQAANGPHPTENQGLPQQPPTPSDFSKLQVDYVIVFSLLPTPARHRSDQAQTGRNEDRSDEDEKPKLASQLSEEYRLLVQRLTSAGLSVTSRPGSKASHELLVLVTAHNETRIRQEIQAERIADWLHGITSIRPEADLASSFLSQPYSPADRLRHLYNIISRDVQPDQTLPSPSPMTAHPHRPLVGIGAGIIPGQAPFYHVKSIFPPHDLEFNHTWISKWSDRSHLTAEIPQVELDRIKEIYGESIGYYFAFLNFYFQALILPTGFGLLFWWLNLEYSSTYSIGLTLWSIVFVEVWKIKERLLAVRWNSFNCHKVEKKRVEFIPEKVVRHLVTNEPVGYFPWWKREARKLATIPVFILFAIGISALITIITAVEVIVAEVYTGPFKRALALLPTVLFAASVPQLVGLWQSTAVKLSNWENHSYNSSYDRSLTHKVFLVQGLVAYAGLVVTAFIYVPFGGILIPRLAGLAHKFIKQESIPLEGSPDLYLNVRALDFSTYSINTGRLYEQLFAYQVTNQIVDTFTEVGLPYIIKIASSQWSKICQARQERKKHLKTQKENPATSTPTSNPSSSIHHHLLNSTDEPDEHELLERLREEAHRPEYRLFVEYAEMAIQFGYIVLWTLIWPISPLFSCVNNFFELRTDAIKLMKHSRRPIPTRSDSIGPWIDVLNALSGLGVMINGILIQLFKPTNHQQFRETGRNSSSVEFYNKTIVADLFRSVIIETKNKTTNHLDLGEMKGGGGRYERLAPILLSGLIPLLISEHAFFFTRIVLKEIIKRFMWKDSESDLVQKRAEWELKQTFIERLDFNSSTSDPSFTNDYFFINNNNNNSKSSANKNDDSIFWSRDDPALSEINTLNKTD